MQLRIEQEKPEIDHFKGKFHGLLADEEEKLKLTK